MMVTRRELPLILHEVEILQHQKNKTQKLSRAKSKQKGRLRRNDRKSVKKRKGKLNVKRRENVKRKRERLRNV